MRIQQINTYNNTSFGVRIKTANILEATTMRIFYNDGIEGFKDVIEKLDTSNRKATGCRGYKYYANILGNKVQEKYPEIEKATKRIQEILEENPQIKKADLYKKIKPIINEIGESIDVTL
jgi:hypothetical protein